MPIARLIADLDTLSASLDRASAELSERNMPLAGAAMLESCPDVLQIEVADGAVGDLCDVVRRHFGRSDALVVQGTVALPQLLVSDMDSTMIGQECIDELADFADIKEKVAAITESAMQGEIDFAEALHARVRLLAGLPESAIEQCLTDRIVPSPGARTLVGTLKRAGCRCILVTGGFHHFADRVAEQLGFDRVVGNRLGVSNAALTGDIDGPISDSSTKRAVLLEEREALGDDAVSLALGDGANDIPMLESADYGIAYRAKQKARDAANGWINRGDLTAVLSLLGVPKAQRAASDG